ncbi:MAG TPA: isoleucine--tRNA ligase [Geobacterales bacterium]|nr:isoleucine--tRNA ligase [Geobacterales bacterium]
MKIKVLSNKYDPLTVEEEVIRFWNDNDIYRKIKEKNKGKKKFYFLDGPPYVTNPIHVGTAWNKIIKDSYLRFYRLKGYDVWDIPGFDMHGLPIEVQVEQRLKINTKKDLERFGVDKFIQECREFALKNLKIQENQFRELGVMMDWENAYMTIKNEYIEAVWYFIKKAHEKGLLYKGSRVVHWCPRCETVLSGYEVAEGYKDRRDPSIYVKFKLQDENAYLLIWTTTPWTLPSNVSVAVHPNEDYVYAEDTNGEVMIFAEKRLIEIEKETGHKFKILKKIKGKELEGKRYIMPLAAILDLQKKIDHRVILSEEFVTMLEGTGCVHMAPGHGIEDFELGKRYNLPAFSPVDSAGRFTEEVENYKGQYVFEANKVIIEDLKALNALLYAGTIDHRYPHCWRCKTPLILRMSDQWFLDVPKIKDRLIEEAKKINWVPNGSLENRVIPWLSNAHEWALSRQRYWGIPLPIWVCEKCDHLHVIGSLQELLSKAIKLPSSQIDLHKPWVDGVEIKCEKCGSTAKRIQDVLDVWVDSGSASWASLSYPSKNDNFERLFPADFIVEGPDQIRGWFYSLLVAGTVTLDSAPMKNVLIHGWSLDETGRAMHKSLGNVINPDEVIPKFGRDTLRIYELSNTTWEDLKFSMAKLQEFFKTTNIIWNTFYFASLYMNIDNYDPTKFQNKENLEPEDVWLLNKINEVKKKVEEHFLKFENFESLRILLNFIVDDVSRWYIRLIRRRVWIEESDPSKEAAYYTLYKALKEWLIMFAPFAPYITEAIYQKMFREIEKKESVHLLDWPVAEDYDAEQLKEMEIAKEIVSKAAALRMKRGIKLRRPVKRVIILPKDGETKKVIQKYAKLIKDQVNTKEIIIEEGDEKLDELKEQKVKINYEIAGPLLKGSLKDLENYLKTSRIKELKQELESKGEIEIRIKDKTINLRKDMLSFTEELKEGFGGIESQYGKIFIDFAIDEEIIAESLTKEVVRRIQMMRKMANLNVTEKIKVKIKTPSDEEARLLKSKLEYLKNETLSDEIEILTKEAELSGILVRDWEIDEEIYSIAISR